MKGNDGVLKKLNELLADELTAINQYMVHSEMCANWGYDRLHAAVEKRAKQEMHHAENLIARIIFLEGVPTVSKLNAIHIGVDVEKQLRADLEAELHTVQLYNEAIHLADEAGDAATRTMFESILNEEDQHVDWIEEQLDQVAQMGVPLYLAEQTRE
ncbi:MAG: bacterioferritin [Thermoguttaceae bacterium]|jgi:bacterioferritin